MAGINPDFDSQGFRDNIRYAMQMGSPIDPADRPTFVFPEVRTYPPGTKLDQEGRPLDYRIAPMTDTNTQPNLQVDCAVDFSDATADELPVGNFRPTKAVLTMFDVDYAQVKDAKEVLIGGDRYVVAYTRPPLALFDVGLHEIVAFAIDET